LPPPNLNLQVSMQQNEMFLLNLPEEMQKVVDVNDKSFLSKYLYLVWSVSDSDYWFRHHLETKNSELKSIEGARESNRYFRFKSLGSYLATKPVKVRLNHLGDIVNIEN
jgi:CRISPR-associated endonuclease Csn1